MDTACTCSVLAIAATVLESGPQKRYIGLTRELSRQVVRTTHLCANDMLLMPVGRQRKCAAEATVWVSKQLSDYRQ